MTYFNLIVKQRLITERLNYSVKDSLKSVLQINFGLLYKNVNEDKKNKFLFINEFNLVGFFSHKP